MAALHKLQQGAAWSSQLCVQWWLEGACKHEWLMQAGRTRDTKLAGVVGLWGRPLL